MEMDLKIDIIVVHTKRYRKGHEMTFVPPITGIHMAAITPPQHSVRVIHQKVQPIDYNTDADLVALSFFSGFAPEAYRIAAEFKARGKTVVAGGPHVSFCQTEGMQHFDAIVTGEAEDAWSDLLTDFQTGNLKRIYTGRPCSMTNLPTPRYDLLPDNYVIKHVVQATRGCPYSCSFCSVSSVNPGFRMRPAADVIRDIEYNDFPHWWQRKIVWFWDDNLTANKEYAKDLFRRMIPLKRWWLTQASIDIANDEELLDLMHASGCIGVFIGIETLSQDALATANKRHNKAQYYRECIEKIHKRGICVMAGFMSGFEDDTPEAIEAMADNLHNIGVEVPFLSILTPFKGTALNDQMAREDRLILDRGWEFYNGYNVVFTPAKMTPTQLLQSHRRLWMRAFSPTKTLRRMLRSLRYLRPGALLLGTVMNAFYMLKQIRNNYPMIVEGKGETQSATPPIPEIA